MAATKWHRCRISIPAPRISGSGRPSLARARSRKAGVMASSTPPSPPLSRIYRAPRGGSNTVISLLRRVRLVQTMSPSATSRLRTRQWSWQLRYVALPRWVSSRLLAETSTAVNTICRRRFQWWSARSSIRLHQYCLTRAGQDTSWKYDCSRGHSRVCRTLHVLPQLHQGHQCRKLLHFRSDRPIRCAFGFGDCLYPHRQFPRFLAVRFCLCQRQRQDDPTLRQQGYRRHRYYSVAYQRWSMSGYLWCHQGRYVRSQSTGLALPGKHPWRFSPHCGIHGRGYTDHNWEAAFRLCWWRRWWHGLWWYPISWLKSVRHFCKFLRPAQSSNVPFLQICLS